ncbi:terminase small subunit [Azoarcus sp. L1K30]|uniref:terminase small subunit n=1 Tax=Azoarcus sp. L1K30 TaxID=2820277 RepID=UPI001B82B185|nr:terminase small subunit [Azoarcus sp. L1K30]MBR0568375.1 terminase small subunit [Azoarcus sp. L1K30]
MSGTGWTKKLSRFVDEYLKDLNGTQAAIRAGYSEKSAMVQASKMLKNPKVAAAIAERMKDRERRTEITQDRVLRELARVAFFDPRKLYRDDGSPKDITELDDDTAAAVAGLEVLEQYEGLGDDRKFVGYLKKYKIADKGQALTNAMRHLGLFNDKLDLNVTGRLAERLARARKRAE